MAKTQKRACCPQAWPVVTENGGGLDCQKPNCSGLNTCLNAFRSLTKASELGRQVVMVWPAVAARLRPIGDQGQNFEEELLCLKH